MKSHFCAYSLTIVTLSATYGTLADPEIWKNSNLTLIIPGHVIKTHGTLRPDADWESMKPKEGGRLRKEFCNTILSTPYFAKYNIRLLDPDQEEEREYVVTNYPDMVPSLFRKPRNRWFTYKVHHKYDTSYRLSTTDVNSGRERANVVHVFPCLVERELLLGGEVISQRLQEYFISEPFHVRLTHFGVAELAGRLVFVRQSGNANLQVDAFATDPMKWLEERKIYRSDLENRFGLENVARLGDRVPSVRRTEEVL